MGDLRNKARKEAQEQAIRDRQELERDGYTVFYFDFRPQRTFRNLSLGDAFRKLKAVTGFKVKFWRCPVRGLAMEFTSPPGTGRIYDHGYSYQLLHFSTRDNEEEAKRELVLDALLLGIELYRGLPNRVFDEQVDLIKFIITAPPRIGKDEWLRAIGRIHKQTQPLLRTHEADLRKNLLGEKFTAQRDEWPTHP